MYRIGSAHEVLVRTISSTRHDMLTPRNLYNEVQSVSQKFHSHEPNVILVDTPTYLCRCGIGWLTARRKRRDWR